MRNRTKSSRGRQGDFFSQPRSKKSHAQQSDYFTRRRSSVKHGRQGDFFTNSGTTPNRGPQADYFTRKKRKGKPKAGKADIFARKKKKKHIHREPEKGLLPPKQMWYKPAKRDKNTPIKRKEDDEGGRDSK